MDVTRRTPGVLRFVDDDKPVARAFDPSVQGLSAAHVYMRGPIWQRRPACQMRPVVQADGLIPSLPKPLHQFIHGGMRCIFIAHGLSFQISSRLTKAR